MSKVTVLMAAYNAEKYIASSLDSLLNQTLGDIQIVCIDDASTDSTPAILKRYQLADNRIKVITETENRGQAVARNHGIEIADGEYITMLDADDLLSSDALEAAVKRLEADPETDTVLFRLMYLDENGTTPFIMRSDKTSWSGQEAFELSIDWRIHGLYVSKASLFKEFPYDASCRLYSDDNTTRIHYLHSGKVGLCDGIYYYRQHAESMTHAMTSRHLDFMEAYMSLARQIKAEGQSREIRSFFEERRWIQLTGMCGFWLQHRDIVSKEEAMDRFRRTWQDVDRTLLPWKLKIKPGYIPFRSFKVYFLQIKFYFILRRLLGK